MACGVPEAAEDLIAGLRTLEGHYLEHRRRYRAGMAHPQRGIGEREAECAVIRNFERLLAVSSGFGPAWRVDGGKIVSLTA